MQPGPARGFFINVLHKFNLKLGGINHRLEKKELDIIPDKTMVVGIDVAHPALGSIENSPSVVSMVASINSLYAHWPGNVRLQLSRQEIQKLRRQCLEKEQETLPDGQEDMISSSNIASLMHDRLMLYHKNNNTFPGNILIYRDGKFSNALSAEYALTLPSPPGVSEGQYQAVLDLELRPIQKVCENLYGTEAAAPPAPKITLIIVGKRHHTRFYPTNREHADTKHESGKLCNPLNGTLVRRGITMVRGWDFYLQAHCALKGTVSSPNIHAEPRVRTLTNKKAKPAHYVVIHNGMNLGVDQVETFTHNLSYLYEVATKAVSYCSPTYYADILCARGRAWLARRVSARHNPPGARYDFEDKDRKNPKMSAHSRYVRIKRL